MSSPFGGQLLRPVSSPHRTRRSPSGSLLRQFLGPGAGLWVCAVTLTVASVCLFFSMTSRSAGAGNSLSPLSSFKAQTPAYCQPPLDGSEGAVTLPGQGKPMLKMLQVLIRHGDRSSITNLWKVAPTYELCDWTGVEMMQQFKFQTERQNETELLFPKLGTSSTCYPGQLTEKGFLQEVANGRYIQRKYPQLVKDLKPEEVYYRHTYYPRTFQSGGAFLLGLGGPAMTNVVSRTQPVMTQEPLFGVGLIGANRDPGEDIRTSKYRGFCQRAVDLAAAQEAAFKPNVRVMKEVKRVFGPTDLSVADVADPILVGLCNGNPQVLCADERGDDKGSPACLSMQMAKALKEDGDRLYCERYTGKEGGRESSRLSMQPFLSEVVERFKARSENKLGLRLALYAAHDTVVAPLVAALDGFIECKWPPYASRVVFELWGSEADDKANFVRILYNGRVVSDQSIHCGGVNKNVKGRASNVLTLECFEQFVTGLLGPHQSIDEACAAQ